MTMKLSLKKGSDRNTQAHIVTLGNHDFYFSYETCIAYCGPLGTGRLQNYWGPTTSRHLSDMGCKNWPVLDDAAFEAMLERALQ